MRIEHDLLGTRQVPSSAYWGIHTLRAVENFPVTGVTVGRYPELVTALAAVKAAAALANRAVGELGPRVADGIVEACREVIAGRLHEEFVVDVLQGGAGTSTNMNANEVIANRALELLGEQRGRYDVVHPIEHVNRSQSTNDTYATAVKIAVHHAIDDTLVAADELSSALSAKSDEFRAAVKVGRTQLQDAAPMTLGQEIGAFATMIRWDRERLTGAAELLREVNLGGTAVGTGLTAPPGYAELAVPALARLTGIPLVTAADRVESTQSTGAFVAVSGALKGMALRLSKICNDLRLLSSGPRAGLAEITLPAVQAGSSIMPGKVNPVIPEAVNQIAFAVVGRDLTVTLAAEGGQLQLNAFEPVIAVSLLDSLHQLAVGYRLLAERCVAGITADTDALRRAVEESIGLVTALLPVLGYERSTALAEEARVTGCSVVDLVRAHGIPAAEWDGQLLRACGVSALAEVPAGPTGFGGP